MLTNRSQEKELLDLGSAYYTKDEYEQCLHQLFRINQLTGIFNHTVKLIKEYPDDISIADVGCGGGLFLLHLGQIFPKMHLLGLDISPEAIRLAQNELDKWKIQKNPPKAHIEFQLQQPDEFKLAQESIDIILLTFVCHHFDDLSLIDFLQKAQNAVRKVLIIHDLHRNSLAYWFYKLVSPIVFKNRLITHDGLISIKRSFTRKELHTLLKQANINNYQIKWCFPFRWNVLVWKNNHDN